LTRSRRSMKTTWWKDPKKAPRRRKLFGTALNARFHSTSSTSQTPF